MKRILILLSIFFVFLSFFPTLYEIQQAKNLPKERAFELVHNYIFDYNFYLSRIKEGQEGKWLVTEKYYNQPHKGSLFQIFYLYLGKMGGFLNLSPPIIYHGARVILGVILLLVIGKLAVELFPRGWSLVAYLFIVTAGSWPIVVKLGNGFRFSTHWGGWSAIDSLQRITFIPHVLLGQIFLVFFVWKFSDKALKLSKLLIWGLVGFIVGIIFPPILIVIYMWMAVMTMIDIILYKSIKSSLTKIVFFVMTLPALLYLQVMFKILPWSALAQFDIQHRSILPYTEYALALGPMLPMAIAGIIIALVKKDKKFFPFISWILSLGLLFVIFEHVPQQSPTRFTQMLITVPLGILATYFFYYLWQKPYKLMPQHKNVWFWFIRSVVVTVILLGLGVMFSMVGWKTDEVRGKQASTWLYPVGVQLVYPLIDFMDGINYLKNNTKTTDVVLAYEAAGNYIPAYAGNFVYLGHANTPDEDNKLKIAARFFKGEMTSDEAKNFLTRENIKYIYFGPQEREVGGIKELFVVDSFIVPVYKNAKVDIYKVI